MPTSLRPTFIANVLTCFSFCFTLCFAPPAAADIIAGQIGSASEPNILSRFTPEQSGDVAPAAVLGGAATELQGADGLYYDDFFNHLWVSDFYGQEIFVFQADASGNATPLRSFTSPSLGQPRQLTLTANGTEVAVLTSGGCCVTSYPATASGATGALRSISWGGGVGGLSRLDNASGLAYAAGTDELWVGDYGTLGKGVGGELLVFARTTNGNVAPARVIFGAATGLGEYVSGVAVNEAAGEVYAAASDTSGGAIVTFPLSAQGDVAPLRRIAGPATGLESISDLAFDPESGQLVIAVGTSQGQPGLRTFAVGANGNVAPLRIISGPATGVEAKDGGWYALTIGPPKGMLFKSGFEPR